MAKPLPKNLDYLKDRVEELPIFDGDELQDYFLSDHYKKLFDGLNILIYDTEQIQSRNHMFFRTFYEVNYQIDTDELIDSVMEDKDWDSLIPIVFCEMLKYNCPNPLEEARLEYLGNCLIFKMVGKNKIDFVVLKNLCYDLSHERLTDIEMIES